MSAAIRHRDQPKKGEGRKPWNYWTGKGWSQDKRDAKVYSDHLAAQKAFRTVPKTELETVTVNRYASRSDMTDKVIRATDRSPIQSTLNAQASLPDVFVLGHWNGARNFT